MYDLAYAAQKLVHAVMLILLLNTLGRDCRGHWMTGPNNDDATWVRKLTTL